MAVVVSKVEQNLDAVRAVLGGARSDRGCDGGRDDTLMKTSFSYDSPAR